MSVARGWQVLIRKLELYLQPNWKEENRRQGSREDPKLKSSKYRNIKNL